ncbi:MAG: hypothetical protein AAGF84_04710 [Planctomycetota bacterium]
MSHGPQSYHRRVLLDLFNSGWVLLPSAVGVTSILADWAATGSVTGWGTWLGLTGLLVGAGAMATRWLTGADRIAAKIVEEERQAHADARQRRLAALRHRLLADQDETTNSALVGLIHLEKQLEALLAQPQPGRQAPAPELVGKVRELIDTSLSSLERAAELHEVRARVMTSEAREKVEASRQDVIREVVSSVSQIARAIDGMQTLHLHRNTPAAELSRMRRELDESLDVARRVEQRMTDLEHRLDGHPQGWETIPTENPTSRNADTP